MDRCITGPEAREQARPAVPHRPRLDQWLLRHRRSHRGAEVCRPACTRACLCACMRARARVRACMCHPACTCACACLCVCMRARVHAYVCVCPCMLLCMHLSIYVYLCVQVRRAAREGLLALRLSENATSTKRKRWWHDFVLSEDRQTLAAEHGRRSFHELLLLRFWWQITGNSKFGSTTLYSRIRCTSLRLGRPAR